MEFSFRDLLDLLSRNLKILVIGALAGLAAFFCIFRFLVRPAYISTVKFYVYSSEGQNPQTYNSLNDLDYAQKIVNTYIEMLKTDSFYKAVKEKSGLDYSVDDLQKMVRFSVLNDTEVFEASVSSHYPEDSKQIADTVTDLAPKTIGAIQESALLKVVDPAGFPTKPSSPRLLPDSAAGFLLGLILSFLYVYLREKLDVRIKGEDGLTARYNIPVLGSIPLFGPAEPGIIIFEDREGKK